MIKIININIEEYSLIQIFMIIIAKWGMVFIVGLKFSFIIKILNDRVNLKNCLDSIISQPLDELEVICVINKNQENSLNILRKYEKMDNRIIIKLFEVNEVSIINSIIRDSTSEYLFLLDSNGWFEYHFISDVYEVLKLSEPDIVLFNFRKFNNHVPIEECYHVFNCDTFISTFDIQMYKSSLMNHLPFFQLKIYKSSFLKKNELYLFNSDILDNIQFNIRSLLMADEIIYLHKLGYNWDFESKLAHRKSIQNNDLFNGLKFIKEFLKEKGVFLNFELEYYKFLFNILEEILNFISISNKENFFLFTKNFLKDLEISLKILEKLSFNQYKFYIHVLNSSSFFEFNLLHNISIFNSEYLENIFSDYGDLISKDIRDYEDISNYLLNEVNNLNFDNIKTFIKINELDLFDETFYRENYNYTSEISPILHYIYKGYKLGYRPNNEFDADFYSEFNDGVKSSKLDPFIYFATQGLHEGKIKFNKNAPQPYKFINKDDISKEILKFHELGINKNKRDKKVIVSLTSFPERMDDIHFVLYSLLNQSFKPDLVILWLAKTQFPNLEKDLPQQVLSLKENGLTICWCDDLKSYKKLLPSLECYPNEIIVTADDDIFYPENWLKQLYDAHKQYPKDIISHRSRKIVLNEDNSFKKYGEWQMCVGEHDSSFFNFATNGAGSLFPPNALNKQIKNYDLASKICYSSDDIWFWAMAILNKTKTHVVKDNMCDLTYVNPARDFGLLDKTTLWQQNALGKNDENLQNVLEMFPQIIDILLNEN